MINIATTLVYTYILCHTDTLGVILHQDGVIQVEVENVTTLVCLSHLIIN